MNPVRTNNKPVSTRVNGPFHYVYVLQNSEGNFYTGCTKDLKKRYEEHNDGKSKYTKFRGPYRLIYYEACLNKDDSFRREKYLKTGLGKRYIRNRVKDSLRVLTG